MVPDEKYIETYDQIGCKYFGKGDDQQLKEWGNSDQRIKEIKIDCVKTRLALYKTGIECYKMLNSLCGGSNVL